MAGSYNFALLRLSPNDGREETLNIGIAVFSSSRLEFHFSKGLEKVRAISRALNIDEIYGITESMAKLDASLVRSGTSAFQDRFFALKDMGAVKLDLNGSFNASGQSAYFSRVTAILKRYVDPEIGQRHLKEKKSRVLSDIKKILRSHRVLAKKHEGLSSHRIVPAVEIDEGLVADLVLRNGAFHVTETVDASNEDASLRSIISNVGISTLVIERARMTFSNAIVKSCLVYSASPFIEKSLKPSLDAAEHFGTRLVNWRSDDDRAQFVQGLASLAVPYEEASKRRSVPIVGGKISFH